MAENTKCEIVISGISGRFPEADNVDEYYEKLINKVDLITENDNRFKAGSYGTPKRFGKIKDLTKFDNKFFGYNAEEMVDLEIEARFLLEITYETIVDAGYDPSELRGKNIGIFIGGCDDDLLPMSLATRDLEKFRSVPLVGHLKSSLLNRISSGFDFKGPSMIVDSACSSAAFAMYEAFKAIRSGSCDAAIVGGMNMIITPLVTLEFHKLNMLSDDGKSKSFDASADGYVRSETISTIFLQKCEDARRIYATLVSVKANNDGFKVEGQTYPSSEMQKRLMVGVLNECNLHPNEISYMEMHATGTNAGDPVEMLAIDNAFCTDRKEPLLVGSVKSNSGHTEPSAAMCQLAKILLSMERGMLPPNLHFNEPHPEIKALKDGRAKVVTEPTPWTGQYIGFNSFGFGGANVHCILKSNLITSQQENERYDLIPQLILYSGRTKEGVQYLLESTTVKEAPREFFALLHKSAYISPMLNPYRGLKLLEEKIELQDIQKIENGKRPLWYVFCGFDAERPAMMKNLMKIEIFAKSIRKSSEILKPFAIDLLNIVVDEIKSEVSSCCKTNQRRRIQDIISTVAVQVALVDVLDKLGLKPDGIIGHNLGELVCAYADGCLTAEQVLTSSFWLAKAAEEVDVPHGTITKMRSSHETLGCCSMSTFNCDVALKAGDGTKQELNHCNCTNNWEHLTHATKKYELLLREAIPDPKVRSSRWKSISHPADKWKDPEVTVASAMYFVHNLLSPVLFDEVLHCIPNDAVIIEIGPQNFSDVTIKTEIGLDVSIISLMKKSGNSVVNLLSSIGE